MPITSSAARRSSRSSSGCWSRSPPAGRRRQPVRARAAPLPAAAHARQPRRALHFTWTTLSGRLRRWLADCDVRDAAGRPAHVTPQQFRHTLATRLVNSEVPLDTVRRLLDHNSAMTVPDLRQLPDHRRVPPQHRDQLTRAEQLIAQAEANGRRRLVEMNEPVRVNLVRIIEGSRRLEDGDGG